MAHVEVFRDDLELDEPTLVEGLPGVGLVGKIAADHLIEQFDMTYYGACHCEGLPEVAVYHEGSREVEPPVRLYADPATDLLVLQSDIPVSPNAATEFASCVTGWLDEDDVFPIYLSGLAAQVDQVPSLYGVATGGADDRLASAEIDPPTEDGLISGPTGALIAAARDHGLPGVGLVVQANPQFPDPAASRVLLDAGIEPVAGFQVDTDPLAEQAQEIAQAKQDLAKRMQQADEESSKAEPLGMYQ